VNPIPKIKIMKQTRKRPYKKFELYELKDWAGLSPLFDNHLQTKVNEEYSRDMPTSIVPTSRKLTFC
jgi:hypothetical protein